MKSIAALIAGALFGLGLAISQMINPLKVLAFLDVLGHWDPSLAFVMGGAIAVTLPGFALLKRWEQPILAPRFQWPQREDIDLRLLTGAGLFGIGWGLAGYCPGPGIAAIALNVRESAFIEPFLFTAAMAVGFLLWPWIDRLLSKRPQK
ncbi:putative membrane protein YedE/YeeE [Natronospira proteinivora]|uniref:Membrane protein YedE/YeeE n=1 Tax=Natronospira proteinivora TaxID=1807133 RepID=A0ABT1G712_9GAMM|nr:DUF6691 family protein [Natronospira proteinivora]MCP1727036.1 putative membrane protein YedE/YeeE [Natronospira proteinivora]